MKRIINSLLVYKVHPLDNMCLELTNQFLENRDTLFFRFNNFRFSKSKIKICLN